MAYTRIATSPYSNQSLMKIYIEYQVLSQNITNNTSTIRLQSVMWNDGFTEWHTYNDIGAGSHIYVNGDLVSSNHGKFDSFNTFNILNTHDMVVTHETDGTKAITVRALHYTDTSFGNGDVSGTVTLPRISRHAIVNDVWFPNDEADPIFNITNNTGKEIYTWLEFAPVGDSEGASTVIDRTHITHTGTADYTMVLTTSERQLIRQKCAWREMRVRMGVRTYEGGVPGPYSFRDTTMSIIPAFPTFSAAPLLLRDINSTTIGLTGNASVIIPGYSKMSVSINTSAKAVAKKESTIKYYNFKLDGTTEDHRMDEGPGTIFYDFNPTDITRVRVQAVDQRLYALTVFKHPDAIVPYFKPSINNFTLTRSDGGTGATVTASISGSMWRANFGSVMNTVTLTYRHRIVGYSTWLNGTITLTPSYGTDTFTCTKSLGTFSASNSYEMQLIASDKLASSTMQTTVSQSTPAMKISGNSLIVPESTFKIESKVGTTNLRKPITNYSCPIGMIGFFTNTTPPDGWLKCNGALLSKSTYAELFDVIGYTSGQSGTSFRVPDLRGEFLRGWDDGRGKDSGRVFGSGQDQSLKSHGHIYKLNIQHSDGAAVSGEALQTGLQVGGRRRYEDSTENDGAAETRPTNAAWLACIKYI